MRHIIHIMFSQLDQLDTRSGSERRTDENDGEFGKLPPKYAVQQLAIRLPPMHMEAFKRYCAEQDRSFSNVARLAILRLLKEEMA